MAAYCTSAAKFFDLAGVELFFLFVHRFNFYVYDLCLFCNDMLRGLFYYGFSVFFKIISGLVFRYFGFIFVNYFNTFLPFE